MTFANHNHPAMGSLVRPLIALSLLFLLCAPHPAAALDSGAIVVASIKGEVQIAVRGAETQLRAGSVLELPATVRTGRNGAVELRQGATSISVGPETVLEFPALASPGGSIDRIVQPRGTSFYNVGKRGGRKLRIETPFLVGVVKGTQFSVVAQDHATTISLFEGLLEVRSADDSDVVELHAGEIASRDRAATDISVLKMEPGATPPVQRAPATKAPAPEPLPPVRSVAGEPLVGGPAVESKPAVSLAVETPTRVEVETPAVRVVPGVEAAIETPVVSEGVNVDLGGGAVVDSTGTAVEVNVGTGVPAVDTGVTVSPDTGVAVDVGVGVGNTQVDLGADLGLVTDVDLGLEEDDSDNSGHGSGSGNSGSGSDNSGSGSDNSGPGNVVDNVADLLEGLTGRSGKR